MKKGLLRKASIGIYNEQLVLKCERYRTDSTHLLGKCKLTNPMLCYVQVRSFGCKHNIGLENAKISKNSIFIANQNRVLPYEVDLCEHCIV